MKLLSIKKPTYLNKKFTATFEHQGKETIIEFESFEKIVSYYIGAKHSCGEKFNN